MAATTQPLDAASVFRFRAQLRQLLELDATPTDPLLPYADSPSRLLQLLAVLSHQGLLHWGPDLTP